MHDRINVAILDDWLGIVDTLIDWTGVRAVADLTIFTDPIPPSDAHRRLARFDVICLMRERMALPAELLTALPRLKLVVTMGRRTSNFDEASAIRHGISIRPALADPSTSAGVAGPVELAWALILGLTRHIRDQDQAVRNGEWQIAIAGELRGKTLGLVGFGRVARAMAPVGAAFGMRCVAYAPSMTNDLTSAAGVVSVARDELFAASDVVSIHAALNRQTVDSIGQREFCAMKRTSILINTARGGIVDEAALVEALQAGEIAGAGLDVFAHEPLSPTHPIRTVRNVLLSPHAGFVTAEALAVTFDGVAAEVIAFAAIRAG